MADVDAVFQQPARSFYDELTPSEQARIDDIVRLICLDPAIDGELKFEFDLKLPTDGAIYYDAWYWVIYRKLNNWTISILNIGLEEEPPSVRR